MNAQIVTDVRLKKNVAKFRDEGIIELNLQDNSKKTGQTVLTDDNIFDKIY